MRAAKYRAAFAAFIIVILVAAPQAQQTQFAAANATAMSRDPGETAATEVDLLVGRSTIVNVGAAITRVSLTVPDIADALVTSPTQLLVHGKAPGTISLFVWDRGGAIKTYEVRVRRDLSQLVDQVKQLFPGEPISVAGNGKDVVLSGTVSSQYVVDKAANVAAGYVEKKENVVNLLKQQEGVASNQVMLRVRFAEVSRSAITQLGSNLFTGPTGYKDWIARTSTQQFAAPNFTDLSRTATLDNQVTGLEGKQTFSDFLNVFVFNTKYNIGTVIQALQEKGLFQSLAEPNLIATNGKEASFLAGGEYPYPVVQGGNNNAITIMFKEFGIRLTFTPTVLAGDLINLKVKPEVSSLDFGNAVSVSGFRIPALSTRRTETEVELSDGQTFAIAGLLNNTVQDSLRKIPGIGDIPVLGYLFKSRGLQKAQTELVVMITPVIVKKGQMGASSGLPSLVEPYMGAPNKTYPNPEPNVGAPRYTPNQPAPPKSKTEVTPSAPAQQQHAVSEPVARPIQGAAQLPNAPAATTTTTATAADVTRSPSSPVPVATSTAPAPPRVDSKTVEKQREQEKQALAAAAKQHAADDQRQAAEAKVAQRKAKEDRRAAEKLDKERAARKAEVTKKNAEAQRRKAEEDQKRDKVLSDAAARLKAAQAAYQAELDKAKGSSNDKSKAPRD